MERFLETERLLLRPLEVSDVEFILRLNSDPVVMRYISPPGQAASASNLQPDAQDATQAIPVLSPTTLEGVREWIEHRIAYAQAHPGLGTWPTIVKASGDCIGWTSLKHLDQTEEIEIGYRYFPQYWGKGYCTEMARAVLRHGFDTVGLRRIVGITHPENLASRRVLEKIGLRYEGMGHYYGADEVYYALNKEDR